MSASSRNRTEQEEHLEELSGKLAESAGVRVLDRIVQRTQDSYERYLLGKGKLKEMVASSCRRAPT